MDEQIDLFKEEINLYIEELFDDEYKKIYEIALKISDSGQEIPEEYNNFIYGKYKENFSYIIFLIFCHIYTIIKQDFLLLENYEFLKKEINNIDFVFNGQLLKIEKIIDYIFSDDLHAKYIFYQNNIEYISTDYLLFLDIIEIYSKLFKTNRKLGRLVLKNEIKHNIVTNSVKNLDYGLRKLNHFYNYLLLKYDNNIEKLQLEYDFISQNIELFYAFITYNKDLIFNMKIMFSNYDDQYHMNNTEQQIYDEYTLKQLSVIDLMYKLISNEQYKILKLIVKYLIKLHDIKIGFVETILNIVTLDKYINYMGYMSNLFIQEIQNTKYETKYMKYKMKYYKLKN